MRDDALSHTVALPIEDIHLMSLVAPIDPHKPVVRDVAFLREIGWLDGCGGLDHMTFLLSLGVSHGL